MINPDLYFLAAAGALSVLFALLMVWRSLWSKKCPPPWPDDIEYR